MSPAYRSATRARLVALVVTAMALSGLTLVGLAPAEAAPPTTGAVSTTTNTTATTGNGACLNGPGTVNCNLYSSKDDVWTTGLPGTASVGDGTYFFAVVSPGGQPDPNDGAEKLLSLDGRAARTFSVTGGVVANLGTHEFQNGKLQLSPYADTPNPGGVYILAVCQIDSPTSTAPVEPSTCKYDAFKAPTSTPPDPGGENPDPLTVTKDAAGTFTTTYGWGVTKAVDKTLVKQVGGNATFNYTVTATRGAGVVSGVGVTGTITVLNPNDGTVVADVTDVLSDGTVCAVTGGAGASIPSGESTFPYSCALDALPQGELDNTAQVTWGDTDLGDEGYLFGDSADFLFSDVHFTGTDVGECADVTDTFGLSGTSGSPTVIGSSCSTTSFLYARTVAVPAYGCLTYDNTATFATEETPAATGSSGTVSVTVCGPVRTGALTMGFWQNKNGQGIITGGGADPSTKVCRSATWLRQYAPLQDLSATATCAQVASYVATVIKAANASGASMNAMLKAQMLATALDVYFTGAGKYAGAQMFLPSASIGSVAVDLTKVCKNIALCSVYENTSSAFGGATSATVSQLLAIASGASNVGGTTWYGQVKATQELAKDTFDAINNQVIFAP